MEQLSQNMFCKNIAHLASIQGSQVSIATAKLAIFLQNILWESCSKFNFKQLSHSMFCKNIASLADNSCCYGNLWSLDTGQTSDILTEHIQWESWSKLDSKQLSHSMFCKNIARLAVAMETRFSWYWPNERYSYRTYFGKVVQN